MTQESNKLVEAFEHLGHALLGMSQAFKNAAASHQGPKVETQQPNAHGETAKAKAKADKAAPTAKAEPEVTEEKTEAAPTEKKAAPKKKKEEPKFDFESSNMDEKVEFLRSEMVKVSAQLKGDRTKVFAFLKKYNANKVNELSEENLVNLYTDIQVFLGGPDALDV